MRIFYLFSLDKAKKMVYYIVVKYAGVAELADALDLGSSVYTCRFNPCHPHQKRRVFSSSFFIHCESNGISSPQVIITIWCVCPQTKKATICVALIYCCDKNSADYQDGTEKTVEDILFLIYQPSHAYCHKHRGLLNKGHYHNCAARV